MELGLCKQIKEYRYGAPPTAFASSGPIKTQTSHQQQTTRGSSMRWHTIIWHVGAQQN